LLIPQFDGVPYLGCLNCGNHVLGTVPVHIINERFGPNMCVNGCGKPRRKRSNLCHGCSISEGFANARNL
jgi:hypothetical protein